MMSKEAYYLGIDIGTTSLKVSLIDEDEREVCCVSRNCDAEVTSSVGEIGFEQCPTTIIKVLDSVLVPLLASHADHNILGIGITGQMHGIVLWKQREKKDAIDGKVSLQDHFTSFYETSNLYTWQDQRCSPSFLASLPPPCDPHQPLATGHGCATICWLLRHEKSWLEDRGFDCCGTIMDLLTSLLCDLEQPVTSDQLAASMGYFQYTDRQWDPVLKNMSDFPYHALPSIVESGAPIGQVGASHYGWPTGVPVFVAMGDVQCAMYPLIKCPTKAIVNIGTSIQLGFLCQSSDVPNVRKESPGSISFFPFFRPFHLALCAGLNGGNAVHHFVTCLSSWMTDLGCDTQATSINSLLEKLQILAEKDADKSKGDTSNATSTSLHALTVRPTFLGERHDPEMKGSISSISLANFQNMGHIFRRLCEGIVEHLCSMVSVDYLKSRGLDALSVCGSVPSKNSLVMEALRRGYGGEERMQVVEMAEESVGGGREMNSAKGAAMIVKDFLLRPS